MGFYCPSPDAAPKSTDLLNLLSGSLPASEPRVKRQHFSSEINERSDQRAALCRMNISHWSTASLETSIPTPGAANQVTKQIPPAKQTHTRPHSLANAHMHATALIRICISVIRCRFRCVGSNWRGLFFDRVIPHLILSFITQGWTGWLAGDLLTPPPLPGLPLTTPGIFSREWLVHCRSNQKTEKHSNIKLTAQWRLEPPSWTTAPFNNSYPPSTVAGVLLIQHFTVDHI